MMWLFVQRSRGTSWVRDGGAVGAELSRNVVGEWS